MNSANITRRKFLENAAIISVTCLAGQGWLPAPRLKNIGLQMYTMRNTINKSNAADTLVKIAAIGYKELEIFGYNSLDKFWGYEPKAFKKLLKANGLKAPAAHIPLTDFIFKYDIDSLKQLCEAAAVVGNKYVILAWLDEQYRSNPEDYRKIASKLNEAALIARKFGLQLAYHNHDFEFTQFAENKTGYSILLENTDKFLVKMELDLYWCAKAGIDSIQLIKDYPGRFPLWHVKDMDAITKDFTEVGSGVIHFKEIFKHAKHAGLEHFFVEQDTINGDVWLSVDQSYRYVRDNL